MTMENPSYDNILSAVNAKIAELANLEKLKKQAVRRAPQGTLRALSRGNSFRFFLISGDSSPNGRFIPRKDWDIAKQIAQRDYDLKIIEGVVHQKGVLERFAKLYNPTELDEVFAQQTQSRRHLITPIRLADEAFVKQWLSVSYEGKGFSGDLPELFTSRGERVRSKSEIIIADILAHYKVPYRYEYPHVFYDVSYKALAGSSSSGIYKRGKRIVVYPDFTCLNVRTRREFIWEHFGLMDDPDYAKSAVFKRELYEKNGLYTGESILFTEETSDRPLDSSRVARLVERFLL